MRKTVTLKIAAPSGGEVEIVRPPGSDTHKKTSLIYFIFSYYSISGPTFWGSRKPAYFASALTF